MPHSPAPLPRYLCQCGTECAVSVIRSWIYVTCTNPKCPEFGKEQLPTYKKHAVIKPEMKI